MKAIINALKPHTRSLVTVLCVGMMLLSYGLLSPWVSIQLPGGLTPPNAAAAPGAPQSRNPAPGLLGGLISRAGGQLPGRAGGLAGAPGTTAILLVPLAAVAALLLTGWRIWKPRHYRLASVLILACGVLALVYYALFFIMDLTLPIPINLVAQAKIGFWIAFVGSLGLFLQILIPRFGGDVSHEVVRAAVPSMKRSGLSLAQNLRVAMDALVANKMRSVLTMLGIIIGVAAVVSMISVGRGATVSVTEQIASTGLNLLTISPGASRGAGVPRGPGGGGGGNSDTLTYEDARVLRQTLTGIDAVLPQYNSTLDVRSDQERLQTSVRGVTPEYAPIRSISIEIGRYLTEAEFNGNARVAVLGQRAAEELFGGLNPIGRDIRIENKRFQIIGVLAEQDGGFGQDPNLEIHVPLTTGYRQLFDARKTGSSDYLVTSIVVAVTNIDNVDRISASIETTLRQEHRLAKDEDNDFSVLNQQSLLDTANAVTGILTVLLAAISSVSLLVGGIGIMNIMLVSVSERTKEIGLRKAIGARRGHILQQFLIETIFLSLIGGILGVGLGITIAGLVNASGVLNAVIGIDSIALGLGFSALVGIFFGVYPANRAAGLEPIEALRYE
jgi:putative ABC transport system permease protein